MSKQSLQQRVDRIQHYLIRSQELQVKSKSTHARLMATLVDPELRSLMMETHFVQTEYQNRTIDNLRRISQETQEQLFRLG